jgi:hypothetical protein
MGVEWAERMIAQEVLAKATTATTVGNYAGVAGAAGVASFAGAPWPVDIGAPAFGAAMFADALSYGAAERGYDIPGNVNPLIQTHAREMVLSPYLSDRIRSLTGDEGGGGSSATHNHYGGNTINVGDTSLRRALQSRGNQRELITAITRAYRRGARP